MVKPTLLNTEFLREKVKMEPSIILESETMIINTYSSGYCKISRGTTISNSKIDKYFAIGLYSFMQRCKCSRYVTIGSRVSIGAFSHPTDWLSTLEFQFRDSSKFYGDTLEPIHHKSIKDHVKTTYIGPDVWIGDNVFIRSGVNIGTGAIIGAGAVVVKDVKPFAIQAGNPAKKIKYRFSESVRKKINETEWWNYNIDELNGISFDNIEKAIQEINEKKKRQGL